MERVFENDKGSLKMNKLKVALICHVSNKEIRDNLKLSSLRFTNFIKRIIQIPQYHYSDRGMWNTLLFNEFKKYNDIELHAIIPHPGMKTMMQSFEIDGIYYHCFNQERGYFDKSYKQNRYFIHRFINEIQPDLINLVGIESPFYSLSALDIDIEKYPLIVSMQTALSDPDFITNYPLMDKQEYETRKEVEQSILKRAHYIATDSQWYRTIANWFNPDAVFLRYQFCASQDLPKPKEKECDFAYWAADISKAGEDAVKAFIEASKIEKGITMNVIGRYSQEFLNYLISMLEKDGLEKQVVFSGYYETHNDALCQVAKSRFALVPIKVDTISTTVREAIQMQMPVVTYATKGTPSLNKKNTSVLISEIGDYREMGNNMAKLVKDEVLQRKLVENATAFADTYWDNEKAMRIQAAMYHAVYDHFKHGTEIPSEITDYVF